MPSKKEKEKAFLKQQQEIENEMKKNEDASWNIGVNKKALERDNKKIEKHEKQMEKKKIMDELLTNEDCLIKGKKPKGKGTDNNLKMLNDALKSAPKSKIQKEKEIKDKEMEKKRNEANLLMEQQQQKKQQQDIEEKKLKEKGIIYDRDFDVKFENKSFEDEINITGINEVLDALQSNNKLNSTYNKFYNEQMEILKQQNPGLRLSQYKDKIQKLWKSSDQNPNNKI